MFDLVSQVCAADDAAIKILALETHKVVYSFWLIFLPVFLTSGFLAAWMLSFPILRTHGFSQPVWYLVGGFVAAMSLVQLFVALANHTRVVTDSGDI